jgi:MMPL family
MLAFRSLLIPAVAAVMNLLAAAASFGVLVDAFLLRTLLVPALMHLAGRANWWLPRWLDRALPHLPIEPGGQAAPHLGPVALPESSAGACVSADPRRRRYGPPFPQRPFAPGVGSGYGGRAATRPSAFGGMAVASVNCPGPWW